MNIQHQGMHLDTSVQDIHDTVQHILNHPHNIEWSLQGFGMLRAYMSGTDRLHIWDDRAHEVPGVSRVHDHPWDFESHVVSGTVYQIRYGFDGFDPGIPRQVRSPWWCQRLKCGPGACLTEGGAQAMYETWSMFDIIESGQTYTQKHDEAHASYPSDGTITYCRRRVPTGGSPDHARVFWRDGDEWVSAEPREATREEVEAIVGKARELYFGKQYTGEYERLQDME